MATSLVIQWLRLHTSVAGDTGSIPDWGTKIPNAAQCGRKKENKKDFLKNYFTVSQKAKMENLNGPYFFKV